MLRTSRMVKAMLWSMKTSHGARKSILADPHIEVAPVVSSKIQWEMALFGLLC